MCCSFWEKCKNSPKTSLGCSTPLRLKRAWNSASLAHQLPEGYSNHFLTECAARGLKPLPISNGWIDEFFRNFRKSRLISKGVSASKTADFAIFSQILWNETLQIGFFWPKWDPCLRIFGEKVTHLGGTSPHALSYELPPSIVEFSYARGVQPLNHPFLGCKMQNFHRKGRQAAP